MFQPFHLGLKVQPVGLDLFAGQPFGIAGKILASLLKSIKNGHRERIDAGEAPQPRLGKLANSLDLSKSEEDFQSEL